ncbi:MAG: hypothetical protein HFJ81_02250 [Clostridia bacterium]|nr:hypothetical protein [Clostridia bacterium]
MEQQTGNLQLNQISKLLSFLQEHPSQESDDLAAIVLKMGLDCVAKKPKQTKQNHVLKFTKGLEQLESQIFNRNRESRAA